MPIPTRIIPIWNLIHDEAVELHAYWLLFNQLFGVSQDQFELLNGAAGFCFYVIEDAIGTDIQLTLSKLSDPAEMHRRENATIEHLFNEIRELNWTASVEDLHRLCLGFIDSCEPIRARRNKIIAHTDRAIALRMATPPPDATIQQISEALQALRNFMNAVAAYLDEPPTGYEDFMMSGQGGEDLVLQLKMAARYQQLQTERKIPWDDLTQC